MSNSRTPREDLENLLSLARRALSRWWLILGCAALGAGGGVLLAKMRTPTYESETLVMYQESAPVTLSQGASDGTRDLSLRIRDLLMTRQRFEKVITEIGLYPDVVEGDGMPAAFERMRKDVVFQPHGTGSTFIIRYRSSSPELAQKVADRLATSLIEDDAKLRTEQASTTSKFLEAERDRTEGELHDKEKLLAEFIAEHPEFAQDESDSAGAAVRVTTQPIEPRDPQMDGRLYTLTRQRERLVARLRESGKSSGPVDTSARDAALDAVHVARREVEAAQRELDAKLASYTERHPDVAMARSKLAAARQRLSAAQAAVPPPPTSDQLPPLSAAERAEIQNRIAEIDDEITAARRSSPRPAPVVRRGPAPRDDRGLVELETEWRRLNREVTEARERTQLLQSRLFQAQIAAASETKGQASRMKIIDPAVVPTRPLGSGGLTLVLAGGFLLGGLGLLVAFLLAWLDDRVHTPADIERLGVGPLLVFVPAPPRRLRAGSSRPEQTADDGP